MKKPSLKKTKNKHLRRVRATYPKLQPGQTGRRSDGATVKRELP